MSLLYTHDVIITIQRLRGLHSSDENRHAAIEISSDEGGRDEAPLTTRYALLFPFHIYHDTDFIFSIERPRTPTPAPETQDGLLSDSESDEEVKQLQLLMKAKLA